MSGSFEFHFQELDKIFRKFSGNEAKRKAQIIKILKEAYCLRRSDTCEPFIPATQSEWVNLFLNPDTVRKKTVRENTQVYFPKKNTDNCAIVSSSLVPNYSKASFKKKARILNRAQLLIFNLKKIHQALSDYSAFDKKKSSFTTDIFKSASNSEEFVQKYNLSADETPSWIFEKIASLENLKINDIDIKRSGRIEIPKKNLLQSGFILRNKNSSYIPNKWLFFIQDIPYILNGLVFQKDNGKLKVLKLNATPENLNKLISVYSQYVTTETFENSDRKEYFDKFFAKHFWLFDSKSRVNKPFVFKKERDMRLKFILFDKLQYSIVPEYAVPIKKNYGKTPEEIQSLLEAKLTLINSPDFKDLQLLNSVNTDIVTISDTIINDLNKSSAIKKLSKYLVYAYLRFEQKNLTDERITILKKIKKLSKFLKSSKIYDRVNISLSDYLKSSTIEKIKDITLLFDTETDDAEKILEKALKVVDVDCYYWDNVEKTVTILFKNVLKKDTTEKKTPEVLEIEVTEFYQKSEDAKTVVDSINKTIKEKIFDKLATLPNKPQFATVFLDYINLGVLKISSTNSVGDFETKLIARFLNNFSRYLLFGVMHLFGSKLNFSNRELIRDIQAQKKFNLNVNMYIKNIKTNGNFVDIISGIPAQILKIENKNIKFKVTKALEFSATNAAAIHKEMDQLNRARVLFYERLCNSKHLERQYISDTMEAIKSYKLVLQSKRKFQPDLSIKETSILMKILQDKEAAASGMKISRDKEATAPASSWLSGTTIALAAAGAAGVLALSYCYFKSNNDGILPENENLDTTITYAAAGPPQQTMMPFYDKNYWSKQITEAPQQTTMPFYDKNYRSKQVTEALQQTAMPFYDKNYRSKQVTEAQQQTMMPFYDKNYRSKQVIEAPQQTMMPFYERKNYNINDYRTGGYQGVGNPFNTPLGPVNRNARSIAIEKLTGRTGSRFNVEAQQLYTPEDYISAKKTINEAADKTTAEAKKAEAIVKSYETAQKTPEKGVFSTISDNISYIVPLLGIASSYVPYLTGAASLAKIGSAAYSAYQQTSAKNLETLSKSQAVELQKQATLIEEREEALKSKVTYPTKNNFKLSEQVMENYAKFKIYFEGSGEIVETGIDLKSALTGIEQYKYIRKEKLTDVLEDVQMLEFISKYENIIKEERRKADSPKKEASFFDNKKNTDIVIGLGTAASLVFGASELLGYSSVLPWVSGILGTASGLLGTAGTAIANSGAAVPLAIGAAGLAAGYGAYRGRHYIRQGAEAVANAGAEGFRMAGSGIRSAASGAWDLGKRAASYLNPYSYWRVDSMGNRVYNPHYQANDDKKHRRPVNHNL